MGGAMRHLTNFLPELGKVDSTRKYTVLVRESFPDLSVSKNIFLERVLDKESSSWLGRIYSDLYTLPNRLKKESFSAIVSLTNFGPIWSPVPHIFFQRNALYYYPDFFNSLRGFCRVEMILRRRLALESMKRASLIVTPSDTMGDMIKDVCPNIRDKKFKTLHHALNTKEWKNSNQSILPDEIINSWPVLFFPSHLAEFKGYRLLFDAVALLSANYPKLKLVLTINEKDNRELIMSYKQQMERLNITHHVLLVGHIPQNSVWDFYHGSDIMVYPSLCESFGFSMLEAMGMNLPIVASDTQINREICHQAANFFSPKSSKECAKKITEVLENKDLKTSLISAAKARLYNNDWGWQNYAEKFVAMLEDLKL